MNIIRIISICIIILSTCISVSIVIPWNRVDVYEVVSLPTNPEEVVALEGTPNEVFLPRVPFGGVMGVDPICDCTCSGQSLVDIDQPSAYTWPEEKSTEFMLDPDNVELHEHAEEVEDLYGRWTLGMAEESDQICWKLVCPGLFCFCVPCGVSPILDVMSIGSLSANLGIEMTDSFFNESILDITNKIASGEISSISGALGEVADKTGLIDSDILDDDVLDSISKIEDIPSISAINDASDVEDLLGTVSENIDGVIPEEVMDDVDKISLMDDFDTLLQGDVNNIQALKDLAADPDFEEYTDVPAQSILEEELQEAIQVEDVLKVDRQSSDFRDTVSKDDILDNDNFSSSDDVKQILNLSDADDGFIEDLANDDDISYTEEQINGLIGTDEEEAILDEIISSDNFNNLANLSSVEEIFTVSNIEKIVDTKSLFENELTEINDFLEGNSLSSIPEDWGVLNEDLNDVMNIDSVGDVQDVIKNQPLSDLSSIEGAEDIFDFSAAEELEVIDDLVAVEEIINLAEVGSINSINDIIGLADLMGVDTISTDLIGGTSSGFPIEYIGVEYFEEED